MLNIFEYISKIWEKRELKRYLCELPGVGKEEPIGSIDSALDEIVISLLH